MTSLEKEYIKFHKLVDVNEGEKKGQVEKMVDGDFRSNERNTELNIIKMLFILGIKNLKNKEIS